MQKETMKKQTSASAPTTYLIEKIYPFFENLTPFLFFGTLIGFKIYHFIDKFDFVTGFMSVMYGIDPSFNGLKVILFSRPVLDFVYTIAAILFDAVVIFSYAIRRKPSKQGRAHGFRERWYPIITILLPMISFTYILYRPFPIENDLLFHSLYQSTNFVHLIGIAGLFCSIIGCSLSIIVLWKLKRSFSLMVEVRQLVTTGLYKYMRHPLYFAELLHALGTILLLLNSFTVSVYIIFVTMQAIRAKFEERKFLKLIPEYAIYKTRTGFLFPKFRTSTRDRQKSL